MYTVAVLLLGAAVGAAQTAAPLAIGHPREQPGPKPIAPQPSEGPPIKPAAFHPDEPPPQSQPAQGSLLSVEAIGPTSIAPDQPLTYEIVVRNAGSNTLGGVHVEDVLPPGTKLRSADPEAEVQRERLVWNLGNFDPGVERRIKVEIQPGPAAGEVSLTPTASFTLAQPCRTLIVRPPFAVTQTVAETAPRGPVTFQIHVANYSNQVISKIQLYDTLPAGLVNTHGDKIICDIASLAPGETKTITLETQAVQSGRMTNRVRATADGGFQADSEASVLITETPLQVRLDAPAQALTGQDIDFHLEVSNPGTLPAANVRVMQLLPDGFEFQNASTGGRMDAPRRTVFWSLGTLPAGQKQTLTLKLRCLTAGDWMCKTAMTADGASEATAFQTVHLEAVPALSLDIVRHEDAIDLGAESVYEVRVLNLGALATPNVRLIANVSAGLLMLGGEGPTTVQVQPKQLVFEPLSQLSGRAGTVYRIRVKGQTAGEWGLTVQATADQLAKPLVSQVTTHVVAKQ
jgi:uncharacterized repeat protein (TIGR01451 family)